MSLIKVKSGSVIEITWVDASITRNAKAVSEKVYATYKRSLGWFLGVYRERLFGKDFAVLVVETTNGRKHMLSVPLENIVEVCEYVEKAKQA